MWCGVHYVFRNEICDNSITYGKGCKRIKLDKGLKFYTKWYKFSVDYDKLKKYILVPRLITKKKWF